MQVELYDASIVGFGDPGRAVPLEELASRTVSVAAGMTVSDVLTAGEFMGASSFALLTDDVAADVRKGQPRTVAFAHNLFGVSSDGALVAERSILTSWDDFQRAVQAGVYEGDAQRLVVYPYGTAGGSGLNDWVEVAQTVWDARDEIGSAIGTVAGIATFKAWVQKRLSARAGQQLRRTGEPTGAMKRWVDEQTQFSTGSFVEQFQVPGPEAEAVLRDLGYQRGIDNLWRPRSPQTLIEMNTWVANHDAFAATAFAERFQVPDVEARLLLKGFGLHPDEDGSWNHKP